MSIMTYNFRYLFSVLIVLLCIASCTESYNDQTEDRYDRAQLLSDINDYHIVPAYRDYLATVESLSATTQAFVNDVNQEKLDQLQASWLSAYTQWQWVEMINIGPAEEVSLINKTNVFPTDVALIDQHIESGEYNLDLPSNFVAQGFPAIDYLIHDLSGDEQSVLDRYSNNLSARNYLADVVAALLQNTEQVVNAWDSYKTTFVENDGSSATGSINKLVNDYLFYYEKYLRAGKVGIPAGVFSNSPLSNKVEAFYSQDKSKVLLEESLKASVAFFSGSYYSTRVDALSFQSYIQYLEGLSGNDNGLDQLILNQFDLALERLEPISQNLASQVDENNGLMLQLYDALQQNVIYMKVDMLQLMNVKVDYVDADGD